MLNLSNVTTREKMKSTVDLRLGDCLKVMPQLEAQSFDAIIADIPYGTTACKWDTVIPFAPMWENLKRLAKPKAAIVLFGSQPFTSALVMSNIEMFKYEWIWDKVTGRGHLVAKKRPMAQHENICVFGFGAVTYNPIMEKLKIPQRGASVEASRTLIMGGRTTKKKEFIVRTHEYPKTIKTFGTDGCYIHPTQKPVALLEYLVRTYTNEGDTVLDFTMGSGTCGVACVNTRRNFVGIEKEENYFAIAQRRIAEAQVQMQMDFDAESDLKIPEHHTQENLF